MNQPYPDHSPHTRPHESPREAEARRQLGDLLRDTPIPPDELVDNLALYLGRKPVMDLLALDTLYRAILDVPGVIMEFGVRWGRHLGALTALRSLHEPYDVHRRIIGFDTFTGFPSVSDVDRVSRHATPGGLAVPPDYPDHLERVTTVHESTDALGHVRRTIHLVGDVRETLPRYLRDNPHTVIALAYFDLDLYEPTRHPQADQAVPHRWQRARLRPGRTPQVARRNPRAPRSTRNRKDPAGTHPWLPRPGVPGWPAVL